MLDVFTEESGRVRLVAKGRTLQTL
nr:hypothetical protein [Klebsiella pneumoniae]